MKKKHWQVSVFDKTSETIRDDTFYTTDTEVYLTFELIDKNFKPDSATVTIYNIYGTVIINSYVVIVDGIVNYEMPVDAIRHLGGWRTQVVFTKDNEDYTTKIIEFDVGGHLLDNKKTPIFVFDDWNRFIKYADRLVDDWEQLEKIRQANERKRELAETVRKNTFNINESNRQTNELDREEAESNRQSIFEQNEQGRESAESVRVSNESERISKDSARDSKIENIQNEVVSARDGETVLGDRLDRIESTKKITVEDFIGFQDGIGGRNLVENSKLIEVRDVNSKFIFIPRKTGSYTISFDYEILEENETITSFLLYSHANNSGFAWVPLKTSEDRTSLTFEVTDARLGGRINLYAGQNAPVSSKNIVDFIEVKVEKGNVATDWTPAPEDYEEITLADLGNHANIIFVGKLTKLNNAITALGGNI